MLDDASVVLSHFSLRYATLDERLDAAAGAGFASIGLSITAMASALGNGARLSDLRRDADRRGLRIAEIEALRAWPADEVQQSSLAVSEDLAFRMADTFGSRYLQVIGPYPGSTDDAAESFAGLCDRAAEHGLTVGIEFLPFTNISDADGAGTIARAAGRPNGGVCIDSWHHFRGANDDEQLVGLGAELIKAVQVDDGLMAPENPDYLTDCLENRRVPGEGEFDLIGFIRVLDGIGVTVPASIEVISTDLQALPADEVCRRLRQSWTDLLSAAR